MIDQADDPDFANPAEGGRQPARGLSDRALARALAFMDRRLGAPLTLDDLAEAACVSRSHFARRFRVSMGCTAMSYLYRLRIERAKELLLGSEPSLGELAHALGFAHQSHFTRVFHRHTGLSPSTFKRRHREVRAVTPAMPATPVPTAETGFASGWSAQALGVEKSTYEQKEAPQVQGVHRGSEREWDESGSRPP